MGTGVGDDSVPEFTGVGWTEAEVVYGKSVPCLQTEWPVFDQLRENSETSSYTSDISLYPTGTETRHGVRSRVHRTWNIEHKFVNGQYVNTHYRERNWIELTFRQEVLGHEAPIRSIRSTTRDPVLDVLPSDVLPSVYTNETGCTPTITTKLNLPRRKICRIRKVEWRQGDGR